MLPHTDLIWIIGNSLWDFTTLFKKKFFLKDDRIVIFKSPFRENKCFVLACYVPSFRTEECLVNTAINEKNE
jgi:hypothetical protein